MRRRGAAGLLAGAVLAAALLTVFDARLASPADTRLVAGTSTKGVPFDKPFDYYWDRLPKIEVPLSAQNQVPPMGGRGSTMWVRAVHDATDLYVLLEWDDPTQSRSAGRVQDFTDAAALEFPADGSVSVPALCMGDPTNSVNIWQWRASWQDDPDPDITEQYPNTVVDEYPFAGDPEFAPPRALGNPVAPGEHKTSVNNLVAGGFGSLTSDPHAGVQGFGEWRAGRWRVVLRRPFQAPSDGNVSLPVGVKTNVAFAVWDGGADERNGMKSVGNFATLVVSPDDAPTGAPFPYWPAPFLLVLLVVVVAGLMMIPREPFKPGKS